MMKWYDFVPAKFEMVKLSKHREFAFLKPVQIRALNLYKIDHFQKYFQVANFEKKQPNLYLSVATLNNIPIFTYHPKTRSELTSVWFKNNYFDEVTGYDLFMDFDKEEDESWEDLIKEIKEFKGYLDDYKVPYYLVFSGNKGFQLTIRYEFLPDGLTFEVDENGKGKEKSVYEFTKRFQEKAKEVFDLKHLDLANNGVPNRLRKLPYSLVKDNVVLPLSDAEFNLWRVENMDYNQVMRIVRIKDRGLLERSYSLTEKELKGQFLMFIREFGLK